MVARIEITSEAECDRGWTFRAQVRDATGGARSTTVTLSWADYNLWSPNGSDTPAEVARAALAFLLDQQPAAEISESFDASILRRLHPQADELIPRWIGR
jgi:hypothetical protein